MSKDGALKLALNALYENTHYTNDGDPISAQDKINDAAIIAIHGALDKPTPPPECQTEAEKTAFAFGWFKAMEARRPWVSLTPEEIEEIWFNHLNRNSQARAVEAKLKENNA